MSAPTPRYTGLEDGQVAPVANPQMPVAAPRSGLPGLLTTVRVFSSLGSFFSLLALILNVVCATILHCYGTTFFRTPGIWFGVPNGVLCAVTLVYSVQMRRRDFSPCLQVTGIIVCVFYGIMTAMAAAACGLASYNAANFSSYSGGLFISVSVFSGLAILVNLILCVLMAVVVSMASGCCRPSYGYNTYMYLPTAEPTMIHQTRSASTQLFPTDVAAPFPQPAGPPHVTSMPPN